MNWLKTFIQKYGYILNILILVINIMLFCGTFYSYLLIDNMIHAFSEDLAIERVSRNLGISPDWQSLIKYLEVNLPEGMPRYEVLNQFNKIGPYVIETQGSCEDVVFQLGIQGHTHLSMWVCYRNDETRSLIDFSIDD